MADSKVERYSMLRTRFLVTWDIIGIALSEIFVLETVIFRDLQYPARQALRGHKIVQWILEDMSLQPEHEDRA